MKTVRILQGKIVESLTNNIPACYLELFKRQIEGLVEADADAYVVVLRKVFEIEKLIYSLIDELIHLIEVAVFRKQFSGAESTEEDNVKCFQEIRARYGDSLEHVSELIRNLGLIDSIFVEFIQEILASLAEDSPVKFIADQIYIFPSSSFSNTGERQQSFLGRIKNLIILSLLKGSFTGVGYDLLLKLKSVMTSFSDGDSLALAGHCIVLQIIFSRWPRSFVTESIESSKACVISVNELSFPRYFVGYSPGNGTLSLFKIPCWFLADQQMERMDEYFNSYSVEAMLSRVTLGSFSIDKDVCLFYTPMFVEVMHEFIHVLHNLMGANFENVPFNPADSEEVLQWKVVWKDVEEYWVIEEIEEIGGVRVQFFSENGIMREVTGKRRFGHLGIPLCELLTQFELPELQRLEVEAAGPR